MKKKIKLLYLPQYFFYNELELSKKKIRYWSSQTYAAYKLKRFGIYVKVVSFGDGIVKYLSKPFLFNAIRSVKNNLQAIYAIFNLNKYDIILTWMGSARLLLLLRCFLKWDKPKVFIISWRPFNTNLRGIRYKINYFLAKKIYNAADKILVASSLQRRQFSNVLRIPKNKIEYLPEGIDHNYFKPNKKKILKENFVLSVGSADRDDESLIKVFNNLSLPLKLVKIPQIYCKIKYNKYKIKTDNVPYSKLLELYKKCLFVILTIKPNSDQPAGLTSLLEAMSMGNTVIMSKSLGTYDYIIDGKNGIIVPPGSPKKLKEAIYYLYNNKKKINIIGKNARKDIEKKFNIEIYCKNLYKIILNSL